MTHRIGVMGVAGGGGGSPIDYRTEEDIVGGTFNSATFASFLSLAMTAGEQTANAKYVLFWSVEMNLQTTATSTRAKIQKDGVDEHTTISNFTQGSTNAGEFCAHGGLIIHDAGGTPANVTFDLMMARGAASGTVTWKNARLTILKLGADDYYQEALTRQTTTSLSLVTAATLNFTPGSTGDYLIIASYLLDNSATNVRFYSNMTDGGTSTATYAEAAHHNSGDFEPWCQGFRLNGVSGSKSVDLKWCPTGASTAGISEIRMLAIRLDRFANAYTTILGADNGGTETSLTTALSQTFTPQAADHLTLGLLKMGHNTANSRITIAYEDGADTVGGRSVLVNIADSNIRRISGFTHRLAAYAASSRTQALKRMVASGTGNLDKDSAIFTLDLSGMVAG